MPDQHSQQERGIERYRLIPKVGRDPRDEPICGDENGPWVRYDDHTAALQDREAELEAKREEAIRIMREEHAPYPAELAKLRGEKAELEKEQGEKHDWEISHFGRQWECQRCGQMLNVRGEGPPPTFGCEPPPETALHPDHANQRLAEAAGIDTEPSSSDQEGERWPDEGLTHPPPKNMRTVRAVLHPTQPAAPVPSGADMGSLRTGDLGDDKTPITAHSGALEDWPAKYYARFTKHPSLPWPITGDDEIVASALEFYATQDDIEVARYIPAPQTTDQSKGEGNG
jgi:hypothetical protein